VQSFDPVGVERAIGVASRAPSIHNTQPWLWQLADGALELRADRQRQLTVADPDGHSLMVSCGAALVLTELALRDQGLQVRTERFPDTQDPDLLARFSDPAACLRTSADAEQVAASGQRYSDRRPFLARDVPDEVVESLRAAADGPAVHVHFPVRAEEKVNLAVSVTWADRVEREDPAYVAEMTRWLHDADVHADGVPTTSVPHVASGHPRHTDVPLRDFEIGMSGRELINNDVDERPLIAVLLTESDTSAEQLAAGEAMMRLMLEAERAGLASCPLSQAVDLVAFRSRLQTLMGWRGYPQMMLRLGYRDPELLEPPRTPRRAIEDVLRVA
jgi:nitroreductase